MSYRTKFIDYDSRRNPKTERFCIRCQKDIKPESPARIVHCVDGGLFMIHPEDEHLFSSSNPADMGAWLLGMDCARRLGMEWSKPEPKSDDAEKKSNCRVILGCSNFSRSKP